MSINLNPLDLLDDIFPLWVRRTTGLVILAGLVWFTGPTTHLLGRLAQDKANEFVHEIQQGQPAPHPSTTASPTQVAAAPTR